LIGIPHRVVIGEKSLQRNVLEYRARQQASATAGAKPEAQELPLENALDTLLDLLAR
ncbi:MAG: hypothetical protein KJO24_02685, partial [Gammaproteobacteria bacterium]|nr:hypothetical protein [Gammaproteobacteria bacterium]